VDGTMAFMGFICIRVKHNGGPGLFPGRQKSGFVRVLWFLALI